MLSIKTPFIFVLLLLSALCVAGTEVARFEFEGNYNDSSGNANHGTAMGPGVTFAYDSVRAGQVACFDGDPASYICVSNEQNFDFTDAVTLTAWIKAGPQTTDWVNVITKFDAYDIVRHWYTDGVGGGVKGIGYVNSWTPVFDDQWHFIAMTYDGANVAVYVDSTKVFAEASGQIPANDNPLRIGGNSITSMTGCLDDVRIYDYALTAEQVDLVMWAGNTGSCETLAGDLNGDCTVSVLDLALFVEDWLIETESNSEQTGSGLVDYCDFSILAANWQKTNTSVYRSSDAWFMENTALKVAVNMDSGSISVYDKDIDYTWSQPCVLEHKAFTDVAAVSGELQFRTKLRNSSDVYVDCNVKLVLPSESKELQVSMNTVDPEESFARLEGFEPFAAPDTQGSSIAVADYSSGHLYPTDIAGWDIHYLDYYAVDMLTLPWLAIVDVDSGLGYSVTIDTPYDAILKCRFFNGRRAPLIQWRSEKGKMGYERRLIYNFTSTGGYVSLARQLRSYMKDLGYVKTLAEKSLTKPDISKLYGAVYLWDYFHCMDAAEMYNLGVLKAVHHIANWDDANNRKPSDAAGITSQKDLGWIVEEYQSYADAYACNDAHPVPELYYDIFPDNFMKDQYGEVRLGWSDSNGQQYKRCSDVYVQRASEYLPTRLSQYPMNGLYLDVTPVRELDECWDVNHPKTRRESQVDFSDLMKYISDQQLVESGENGKWWSVPYLDIPMGLMTIMYNPWGNYWPSYYRQLDFDGDGQDDISSHKWDVYETYGSLGHKYRAPLWQLVFHDCTSSVWYCSDALDITAKAEKSPEGTPFPFSYQKKKEAISILYGSVATFTTIDPTTSAGAWFDDRLAFMRTYRNVCKFHEIIADKQMLSHEFMTPDRDVQKTVWSDGTVVVANFGADDYAAIVDGTQYTLKQFGWVVSGPDYKASCSYDAALGKEITEISQPGVYYSSDANGTPVAIRKISDNELRVNGDDPGSPYAVKFWPKKVISGWDMNATVVYICDKYTGLRLGKLPFSVVGDRIDTVTISGWAVLDVVCE